MADFTILYISNGGYIEFQDQLTDVSESVETNTTTNIMQCW
jgi:hypothetical protein